MFIVGGSEMAREKNDTNKVVRHALAFFDLIYRHRRLFCEGGKKTLKLGVGRGRLRFRVIKTICKCLHPRRYLEIFNNHVLISGEVFSKSRHQMQVV